MKRLITAVTIVALFAIGTQAMAEDDRAAMAKEQMQQTFERLDLTDEQIEQVRPVLEKSAAEQQEILARYGIDLEAPQSSSEKPGRRQLMAMRKGMEPVRKNTLTELGEILSDEQLEELKRIQEERRAEMRGRMRGGR